MKFNKDMKVMEANMDKVINLEMTKLFLYAEYVCSKCSSIADEPAATLEVDPTIRFTNEDRMIEGELFE